MYDTRRDYNIWSHRFFSVETQDDENNITDATAGVSKM